MRTVLIGIARVGSTRLPGKVLMDLGGKHVLQWVIEAGRKARLVDDVCIATTTDPKDDLIEKFCDSMKCACYRGSEDDVLRRFTEAARFMDADVAVRVTCDCPFIDPHVIDQVIALREATHADYASNIDPPTWPDGLDVEAISVAALQDAELEATSDIDRSCVTSWIYRNRHRFQCETLICPLPGMHKERWVLDTEDDYKFCKAIAGGIEATLSWLTIKRHLDWFPELRKINAHHPRNERFYAALTSEPLPPRTYETSKKLLARAEKVIPLGAQTFSKSKIQYPSESPLFVSHGDGGYCYDVDGNRFVDLVGGLLPVILGHRDHDVDYAVRRQMNAGNCFSLATELEAQLAETLCRLIPCAEMVRFGKNGSDVTSAAVRLARAHFQNKEARTGKFAIINSGYHGWHDWAVACDEVRNAGVYEQYTTVIKHGDVEALWNRKYLIPAAVIIEPETNPEFLRECRKFCDETGALLIFDEIITGFRFDLGGAQKFYGVTPDLACFGKSMANGWPISAIVGKREYMKEMEKISYSGTFFGDPTGIVAAIATIEKLERENVLDKIYDKQCKLCAAVMEAMDEFKILDRRGYGNEFMTIEGCPRLRRLTFANNDIKTLFIQEMAQQGVLIIASHNLSYAHGDNEIKRVVTAYQTVLPMLAEAIEKGNVKDRINGRSIPEYANVRALS